MDDKTLPRQYHELIVKLVNGDQVDEQEMHDILASAGRSRRQLQDDVDQLQFIRFDLTGAET